MYNDRGFISWCSSLGRAQLFGGVVGTSLCALSKFITEEVVWRIFHTILGRRDFVRMSFIMTHALNASGFTDRLVAKFMSIKLVSKSPWIFTISLGVLGMLLGCLMDQAPVTAFMLAFVSCIYKELGYSSRDAYPHVANILTVFSVNIGGAISAVGIALVTTMCGSCAYLLPSSFATIAMLHGHEYSSRNQIYLFGIIMIVITSLDYRIRRISHWLRADWELSLCHLRFEDISWRESPDGKQPFNRAAGVSKNRRPLSIPRQKGDTFSGLSGVASRVTRLNTSDSRTGELPAGRCRELENGQTAMPYLAEVDV